MIVEGTGKIRQGWVLASPWAAGSMECHCQAIVYEMMSYWQDHSPAVTDSLSAKCSPFYISSTYIHSGSI